MTALRNLRAYHIRAQQLKKELGTHKEAWEQTEREFSELEGRTRYENFKSFRQIHWQVITGNYKPFKK